MQQKNGNAKRESSLLLYAPVPLFLHGNRLFVEAQAVNGLRLWARHFDPVTVMMPLSPARPPKGWVPLNDYRLDLKGVRFEPVPMAYRPDAFFRHLMPVWRRVQGLIAGSDRLSFAIGGLFGDWGALSCIAAHRMGRGYAVWTDRVESEVMRQMQFDPQGSWRSRLRGRLYHRPMAWLERAVIRRADLGLFHGAETFLAYAGLCQNPHLVHDIHIAEGDHICQSEMQCKIEKAKTARPLHLIYTGRADAMKGPIDWTTVLERLQVLGIPFKATWLGEGPVLMRMADRIRWAGLEDCVRFPGFVEDHGQVLHHMRDADLFMFCHKTPESPRCLIEALTCGTPILGYEGAYARDVISAHGGGILVDRGDTEALARKVGRLDADRETLAKLMAQARADGAPFSDRRVFAHRADLLKRHLS